MPAPPTIPPGGTVYTGTLGYQQFAQPCRKRGSASERRKIFTGLEGGRGGAATRPAYGQRWPRAIPGRQDRTT
jgi:hypothetical protein